jgi:hypothetical protein
LTPKIQLRKPLATVASKGVTDGTALAVKFRQVAGLIITNERTAKPQTTKGDNLGFSGPTRSAGPV